MKIGGVLAIFMSLSVPFGSSAEPFPIETNDFQLWDSSGRSHTLSYYSDKSAIVFLAYPSDCASQKDFFSWYSSLERKFLSSNMAVFWVDAGLDQNRETVNRDIDGNFLAPVLMDRAQVESRRFGFHLAGDYVVIQPHDWQKTLNGNWQDGGLERLLKLPKVQTQNSQANCKVKFKDRSNIVWDEKMATKFANNCVFCHLRFFNIDIFNSDNDVSAWRAMSLLSIRMNRMPSGNFDLAASNCGMWTPRGIVNVDEIGELENWLDEGAPRKNLHTDYLASQVKIMKADVEKRRAVLGKPDVTWKIPVENIPATGADFFRLYQIAGPLQEDLKVTAFMTPEHGIARHHLHVLALPFPVSSIKDGGATAPGWSLPYTKIILTDFLTKIPNGYILLPKGSYVAVEAHFHPYGKAEVNDEAVSVFTTKKEGYEQKRAEVSVRGLNVEPGERNRVFVKEVRLDKSIYIRTLNIHSHSRGKAFTFTATSPEGHQEILCRASFYHLDTIPSFTNPVFLKKGTLLRTEMTFDNSSQNPLNSDPEKEVTGGITFDKEMGLLRYFYFDAEP
jgi:hypothetical protein